MYLIVGATGNVGSKVVEQLLAAGEKVRVFTRDASKVSYVEGAVEVAVGDFTEIDTFAKAVEGVDAVFLMNGPLDGDVFRRLVDTVKASGNPRVVFLSSLFAAYPDSLIGQLHKDKEDVIRASGLAHSFVRAGNFMTNTFWWLGTIKGQGVVYDATGQGKTAPVAPQDIAAVVVQALTRPDSPEILEVTGGELLTTAEQVAILSRITGRPIQVVEITPKQAEEGMLKSGSPAPMAKAVAYTYDEIHNGRLDFVRDAVQTAKGGPPVTYEEWVESQKAQLG